MIKEKLLKKEIEKEQKTKIIIKKTLLGIIILLCLFKIEIFAINKSVIDITTMDITELSKALELQIITSEELVNLYLDRINTYDENYNSIISINDHAIEDARKLDIERSKGHVRSIMHGIPIIVKDNIDVFGMPTTAGAKALSDNYPKNNSFVVQKLIDSGAIILAKSNMSEFAFYAHYSKSSYGLVKNAYNTDYTAYGSSGGSAVAIANSFAAAALGTDTNSSIRLPAAANNLIGLRPTIGLVSRSGSIPYDPERDVIGPITKNVYDSLIIMNIINAFDESDDKSISQTKQIYEKRKVDYTNITIGIPKDLLNGDELNTLPENKETYTEITKMINVVIDKLEEKGISIVYLDDYYDYQTDGWFLNSLSGFKFCDAFNDYIKNTTGTIRNFTELTESPSKITPLNGYEIECNSTRDMVEKNTLKENYKNYIQKIMTNQKIDLIMYPSTKNRLLKNTTKEGFKNLSFHASSTINYPAITLKLGFDKDNLPYGVEFMAPTGMEQLLFDIAFLHEEINNNDILPSNAPSLYQTNENVNELIEHYKNNYYKVKQYKYDKKWLNETTEFFRNYNTLSNPEIDKHIKELNEGIFTNKLFSVAIIILKIILVLFVVLFCLLNISKFKKKRKKKHKKTKNRY